MTRLLALPVGMALDLIFGDPHGFPHIVVAMGGLIAMAERFLRAVFPKTRAGELAAGAVMAIALCAAAYGAAAGAIALCERVSPWLALAARGLLAWQCLALHALREESMAVCRALRAGDLDGARRAVGWIVGRDTDALDAAGVARAAVETVAENTGDGVVAPMLALALGGAPLGALYKAISTMDSVVGYRNERYEYFGKAAARLDDVANFLPSRIAAVLMALAAPLAGLDGKNAWRVFRRDRYNHKSPNSAQTESVCAGALRVRLGGDARYSGKLTQKPYIGDALRPVEPEDIRRANALAAWAAGLCFALCMAVKLWLN